MRTERRPARAALVLVFAALALAGPAAAQPPLAARLAAALTVPNVNRALSGALAVDLTTGETLYAQNDTRALAPASNEKLAVTYAALVALGADFQIDTEVLGEGYLDGSTWRGDLVLKGYGDPTLTTVRLRALATQVRAAGVRRVTGMVIGDESYFDARRTGPGWKASFYVNESPPLSALTVDRASYRGVAEREPALTAAAVFRDVLHTAGIEIGLRKAVGQADANAVTLGTIQSPPVARIVLAMDRESDNFTAELLLKQLGALEAQQGSSAAGAAVVRGLLVSAGVPLSGVRIADGSGLSLLDRMTAHALVAILEAAWRDPAVRPSFVAALPVAGRTGTLEDRMRRPPARGNVVAKTGTTEQASALSGFVKDRFAFAILQNGHPISSWWARRAQDRFASVLAAQ